MPAKSSDRIYRSDDPDTVKSALRPLLEFHPRGVALEELSQMIDDCLVPHFVDYGHPGFHSLYNFFPEAGADLGARVALQHNQGVTNWQVSPGAVMLEEMCGRALCRLFGLSATAEATFMYSGTYANQQAIYLALHRHAETRGFDLAREGLDGFADPGRLVLVASEAAHFSLRQSLRMMGLGEKSIRSVAADRNGRMDVTALENTLRSLKNSHDVFCVVSTAGTSSIGAIDPIAPVAGLCRDMQIWLHLDAAYGLIYSLLPEKEALFDGVTRADSITWDPHKQMGVPIPSSLLFLKNGDDFRRMAIFSDYFNRPGESKPNPGLKSPPSTRPLAALPLAASIRHLGLDNLKKRLRTPLRTVEQAVDYINEQPDLELMLPPDLGIFCVRLVPERLPAKQLDALQQYLYDTVLAEAQRSVSFTRIKDQAALRFLILTPDQTLAEIVNTLDYLRDLAKIFSQKDPSQTSWELKKQVLRDASQ